MKFNKSLLSATLLASTASAFHYPTPKNAQIGALHFPVTCNAYGFISVTVDGYYTATAPLAAQAGQQLYYTDVTAAITIPQNLIQLASGIGAATANLQLFLDLALTNAQPTTLTVFPNGFWVNGTKLNPQGQTTAHVPLAGVLNPIGPVTMGTAGIPHNIQLGVVKAKLILYNAFGGTVLGPIDVTCPIQTPQVLIAAINVLPQVDANPAPLTVANGFKPAFPNVGSNLQYGCFDFDYDCTFSNKGTFPFSAVACGGLSTYYSANSKFSLANATIDLVAPPSTINALQNAYPGTSALSLAVKNFMINEKNAPLASPVNAVPNGYTVATAVPSDGSDLTVSVPSQGVLQVGQFTAGFLPGQIFYLTIGNSSSHITFTDGSGRGTGDADVTCAPRIKDLVIVGIQTY